jgi:hypothetical protein
MALGRVGRILTVATFVIAAAIGIGGCVLVPAEPVVVAPAPPVIVAPRRPVVVVPAPHHGHYRHGPRYGHWRRW